MQLCLDDSFMIRRIIVAAVPAALVAVGMSLALSEPVSARRGFGGFITPAGMSDFVLNSGDGSGGYGMSPHQSPNHVNTNTNQVYPNSNQNPRGHD